MNIDLHDVAVTFPGKPGGLFSSKREKTVAVRGVTLGIESKEVFVLLGPSGCGKTTLIRAMAGLQKVSAGTIALDGVVANNLPPHERRMSLVPQLVPLIDSTVENNIGLWLDIKGCSKEERRARVREAAARVGVEHKLHNYPEQLSGGERQRVALAANILVPELPIALLDEPLSSLDRPLQKELREFLRTFFSKLERTVVYVTHDQEEAIAIADKIGVMRDGKLEQVGTFADLYEQPNTLFVARFIGEMNILSSFSFMHSDTRAKTLGVRPHNINIYTFADVPGGIPMNVRSCEYRGSHRVLQLEHAETGVQCSAHTDRSHEVGDMCWITVQEKHMHLFDANGRRI